MKIPSQINTNNLIIRPFKKTDLKSFIDFMLNEEVTKYLNFTAQQKTEQGAIKLLEMTLNSYETDNPLFALAITDKITGIYIGSCGIAPKEEQDTYECFYVILPEYRNKGYAKEAMNALLDYAFNKLNILKIIADISSENIPSQQLAKSLGMQLETVFNNQEKSNISHIFTITKYQFKHN